MRRKLNHFIHSAIGLKIVMALTGLLMLFFLLGHVLGNLLVFSGRFALNNYAHFLQTNPLLWGFRLMMLALIGLHIYLGIRAWLVNRHARPQPYAMDTSIQLSISSRWMLFSGLTILIFILFHIAHLTLGWIGDPAVFQARDANHMLDVYGRVVSGFQNTWISGFYMLFILLLGFHLQHATRSLFQTLGFHHENLQRILAVLAPLFNWFLVLSFLLIPIAVQSGWIMEGAK